MGNMERCKEVVLIFKFSQSKIIFLKKGLFVISLES